jgi:hypothetical protein
MSRHADWKLSNAVVITKQKDGKTLYRISPRVLNYDGDVPNGGFLSNWCTTEERAWRAAEHRRSSQINSVESW